MTIRAVSPAPLPDVLALYQATAPMKPVMASAAILQAARSDTIGWFAGDRMIACALLYPLDPDGSGIDRRELLFACRPEASRHLVSIIHAARLTRSRLNDTAAVSLVARVRLGHQPGRRLAALCGLSSVGTEGGCEIFEWGTDERVRQGH